MISYISLLYYSQLILATLALFEVLYFFRNTKTVVVIKTSIVVRSSKIYSFYQKIKSYLYSKIIPENIKVWHLMAINLAILLNSYTLHFFFNTNVMVVFAILFFIEILILYTSKSKEAKENAFDKNYVEILSVFARTYKITSNTQEAIYSLSKNLKDKTIKDVFIECHDLISKGASITSSLNIVLKPFESEKVKFFLSLLKINAVRGLNLSYVFANLADIETREKWIQKEVKNVLFQTKVSSILTALMVPFITLVLMFLSEGYFNVLFNTNVGKTLLTISFIWYLIGVYMINKTLKDAYFADK